MNNIDLIFCPMLDELKYEKINKVTVHECLGGTVMSTRMGKKDTLFFNVNTEVRKAFYFTFKGFYELP